MSVIYVGSGAPTITGATSQVSVANGAVHPFSGVTITDPTPGTLDTLTITIGGIGGAFGALTGLSGSGLTYTITGTAAYITSILESIVFTPVAQAQDTSNTANFTLSVSSTGYGETNYPAAVAPTTLATFDTNAMGDGINPVGQLYSDANGDLFGTTQNYGGSGDDGIVFEIKNNGTFAAPQLASTPTILYTFQGGSDAANPASGFVADANGDLFGTSTKGGTTTINGVPQEENDGTVYELVKNGSSYTERVVASFGPSDGTPTTSLVMDSSGNLYGVTSNGGTYGDGEIFEIADTGGVYASTPTVLYSFAGGADGADPLGSLLIDGAGDLITTTSAGGTGSYPDGTVFELAKSGSTYTPTALVEFNGGGSTDPEKSPGSGLVMDAHGDLFGTSEDGGSGSLGTVFEIVNNGSAASPNYAANTTVLYPFTGGTDGGVPVAQLTIDNNGDLIGTTTQHGADGYGTVFELSPSGASYNFSVLAAISDRSFKVNSPLTIGAGGELYGTLSDGPQTSNVAGGGSVFEVAGTYSQTPVSTTTTVTDNVPAVTTITGAHATIKSGATDAPFAGVTIGDINTGSPTETLTITLSGVAGTLTGSGLSGSGASYSLTGSASTVTSELDALVFTPTGAISGSAETTFTLSNLSSTPGSVPTVNSSAVALLNATVLQTDGSTDLVQNGNNYYLLAHGVETGPELTVGGAAVTTGQFGAWTPIGAVATGGGYDIAWKNSADDEFTAWAVNSSGAYVSSLLGAVATSSPALEALESTFGQDLNGDGQIGLNNVTAIQTDGSTELASSTVGGVTNYYLLASGGSTGPELSVGATAITSGQFGAWTPIGAVATSTGYDVAWKNSADDDLTVWTVNSAGAYTGSLFGAVSGSSFALESIESTFGQDLNGDGTIGVKGAPVQTVGGAYVLATSGTTPELTLGGSPITAGEFGAWTPVDFAPTSTGYDVAWKNTADDDFTAWSVNGGGAYLGSLFGAVSGTSFTLESFETAIGVDLNGDGTVGLKGTLIQTDGSTSLESLGSNYILLAGGPASGIELTAGGSAITSGEFGAWTPIGAVATSTGYDVAWKNSADDDFTAWTVNSAGAYTGSLFGAVSGSSFALESIESTFGQDLNGDGTIGVKGAPVQTVGGDYVLAATGATPELTLGGSPITAGEFGAWTPVDFAPTSTGYDVAWKNTADDDFTAWSVNGSGAYQGSLFGAVSGTSFTLESFETTIGVDLNGDGTVGLKGTLIQTDGATSLESLGNDYILLTGGAASGVELTLGGSAITSGEFGAWTPVGAAQTSSGYEVAWKQSGTGDLTFWDMDANGNYVSDLFGAVAPGSIATEAFESLFNQDLNGDGVIGLNISGAVSTGSTVLTPVGNGYDLGVSGPQLTCNGAPVTGGEFGGWTPIGAEQLAGGGFEVSWRLNGTNEFTAWTTNSSGAYTSSLLGATPGGSVA